MRHVSFSRPVIGLRLAPDSVTWLCGECEGTIPALVAVEADGRVCIPPPPHWKGDVRRPFWGAAPFVADLDAAIAMFWAAMAAAHRPRLGKLLRPILVVEAPSYASEAVLESVGRAAGAWVTVVARHTSPLTDAMRALDREYLTALHARQLAR